MKSKIGNQILVYGFVVGILILGIGIESWILKSEIEKTNAKLETNYKNKIENLDYMLNERLLVPDLHTQEIEIENSVPFFELNDEDRMTICYIVAGEAKGEPTEGKMAVAQCLLNAMAKDGLSVSDVRKKYKYSGWDDGLENSNPDCWIEVCEAVSRVFDEGEFISENPILFFYAPKYAAGKWHETLEFDTEIGGHRFFYLKEDLNTNWFLNLKGVD